MVKFVDELIKYVTLNNIKKLIQADCPLEIIIKTFDNVSKEEIIEIYREVKNEM